MNLDHEKRLEIEINHALKNLPELEAPGSLVREVMARLERRSTLIWYRRSWQTWRPAWQAVFLVIMAALFAGLCFAGWQFWHAGITTTAGQRVGEWFSSLSAITNTLMVLLNSVCLVVKKLGTGFIVSALFAIGLGYVMCVGLGTLYMRLTLVKQ